MGAAAGGIGMGWGRLDWNRGGWIRMGAVGSGWEGKVKLGFVGVEGR
jgi:hypothetical protein